MRAPVAHLVERAIAIGSHREVARSIRARGCIILFFPHVLVIAEAETHAYSIAVSVAPYFYRHGEP
jgi:hypothetical protein